MNRKDNQHILARAAIVLLVAMLSVVTVRAEVLNIGTVAEWNAFAARVNGGETTLGGLLTADLNFSDQTFTVAGTSAHPYCGTFDGASHTITGISVSKSGDADGSRLGLFGSVGTGGTVRNVTVTGSSFAGWNYVGGIAGYNQGGTVTGCHVTSSVTIGTTAGSKEYHGGIVGYNSSIYSTVSHCTMRHCDQQRPGCLSLLWRNRWQQQRWHSGVLPRCWGHGVCCHQQRSYRWLKHRYAIL